MMEGSWVLQAMSAVLGTGGGLVAIGHAVGRWSSAREKRIAVGERAKVDALEHMTHAHADCLRESSEARERASRAESEASAVREELRVVLGRVEELEAVAVEHRECPGMIRDLAMAIAELRSRSTPPPAADGGV